MQPGETAILDGIVQHTERLDAVTAMIAAAKAAPKMKAALPLHALPRSPIRTVNDHLQLGAHAVVGVLARQTTYGSKCLAVDGDELQRDRSGAPDERVDIVECCQQLRRSIRRDASEGPQRTRCFRPDMARWIRREDGSDLRGKARISATLNNGEECSLPVAEDAIACRDAEQLFDSLPVEPHVSRQAMHADQCPGPPKLSASIERDEKALEKACVLGVEPAQFDPCSVGPGGVAIAELIEPLCGGLGHGRKTSAARGRGAGHRPSASLSKGRELTIEVGPCAARRSARASKWPRSFRSAPRSPANCTTKCRTSYLRWSMAYREVRVEGAKPELRIEPGHFLTTVFQLDYFGLDDGAVTDPTASMRALFQLGSGYMIYLYVIGMRQPGEGPWFHTFWVKDCVVAEVDMEEYGAPTLVTCETMELPGVYPAVSIAGAPPSRIERTTFHGTVDEARPDVGLALRARGRTRADLVEHLRLERAGEGG